MTPTQQPIMQAALNALRMSSKSVVPAQNEIVAGAIRALEAALAEPDVPEGWKLVPIEPTREMLDALMNEWDSVGALTMMDNYKAMLAAAPEVK